MKKYLLSEEVINAVLGYLSTKPYTEVQAIIGGITHELVEQTKEVEDVEGDS